MRFNPKARLDTGQVRDAGRGRRGSSLGLPTGKIAGGGGLGLILVIAVVVITQFTGGGGGLGTPGFDVTQLSSQADNSDTRRYDACETGEDAAESRDCARVAVVNSIQAFWESNLRDWEGVPYVEARTVTFSGSVETGCGRASSDTGPFYCPAPGDMQVYEDTSFYRDVLVKQLDGPDHEFVEWYVLGHEYGHHIQNLTGQMDAVESQQGAGSDAVKLELQADCYAGLWVQHAVNTADDNGETLFVEGPSDAEIAWAVKAAQAVGDDHIQKVSSGRVNPDQWTHGSSAEREAMFRTGYTGSYADCDVWR